MGLLTGFVFLLARFGLALWPRLALRVPAKKIGALAALAAGLAYLFLSGGNVATQRAFIMVAVVLIAVLLDRPAFSLRAVALAALLVLLMRPESLTEAGFQMSFAATTALVGVFEILRNAPWWHHLRAGLPNWAMPVLTLIITSATAGLATAPIAAYHFNQFSNFGLIANLLSVPLMGLVIMPTAVLALFLNLFGFGGGAFWLMGKGIEWVLFVAAYFSSLDNSLSTFPSGPPMVLPLIGLSGCLVFLLIGRVRIVGIVVFFVSILMWGRSERPLILVNQNAALIGVMGADGRALNKNEAYSFTARVWLENDGDNATQQAAFERPFFVSENRITMGILQNQWRLVLDQNSDKSDENCGQSTILIAPKWEGALDGSCIFIGKEDIATLSGFSITFADDTAVITPSVPKTPIRPWTNHGAPYQ
jgi:competence protein ComEC